MAAPIALTMATNSSSLVTTNGSMTQPRVAVMTPGGSIRLYSASTVVFVDGTSTANFLR